MKIKNYYKGQYITINSKKVEKAINNNTPIVVTIEEDNSTYIMTPDHLSKPAIVGTIEFEDKFEKGTTYTLNNYNIPVPTTTHATPVNKVDSIINKLQEIITELRDC